ncbi:hypothetical protein DMN77_05330 [Paenibacillus sp. 79R4]|uniref:hypothetical protein n=1 Tax=Paenibacillus sp. 79R4 TaxID=2212847 RepID=UPI0015B8AFCB|nr:hypothetical protein [Paenibacillus sp. 79R4]NWL87019.1 hypothetical protein [Paenibacillus sp. 79R4]
MLGLVVDRLLSGRSGHRMLGVTHSAKDAKCDGGHIIGQQLLRDAMNSGLWAVTDAGCDE